MPNHVHLVFKQLKKNEDYENNLAVTGMLKNLKWFTALKSNQALKRSGTFWQEESFDRVIRDQKELEATIKYVLNNPVKAGLVDQWQDWPYSFCKWKL
jgi:REP element-mobilizing transposase RayT